MGHDVFISYSSHDQKVANAACARLEQAGHRCWIAPRDILSGMEWGKAIVDGIRGARIFVLIFSANANRSPQVNREVERAVNNGLTIIPFRIENIAPSGALEYFISNQHWLDALTPRMARHLDQLANVVERLLVEAAPPRPRSATPTAAAVAPKPAEPPKTGMAALAAMGVGLAAFIAGVTWLLWNPHAATPPPPPVATAPSVPESALKSQQPGSAPAARQHQPTRAPSFRPHQPARAPAPQYDYMDFPPEGSNAGEGVEDDPGYNGTEAQSYLGNDQ